MCDALKEEKADLIKALKLARSESSKLSYALDLAEKSIENKLQEWQDTKKVLPTGGSIGSVQGLLL